MARRKRALKRQPRDTTLALSPCISFNPKTGETPHEVIPVRKSKRTKVVELPNGKLIVRVTNL